MSKQARYQRVLLKISGEAMCSPGAGGIDSDAVKLLIGELSAAVELGTQIALVVGGGNYIRGRMLTESIAVGRITADYMGMLATVINSIALRDAMESSGLEACVLSAIPMPQVCESFSLRQAEDHLSAGRVVILAGGTGGPLFTTDMCAALRAGELGAKVLLKATKVDGVFDDDPVVNANARKYEQLTYQKVLADRLSVMDASAVAMCMENHIPIIVFQLSVRGNLLKALTGQKVGTTVAE